MPTANHSPHSILEPGPKRWKKARASWITNVTLASAATWAPALALGEKPDLQKIQDEAKTLMEQDRYEEALQRQIWYFNHALQYGEANPIHLSIGIMNWAELGRRYPKAKQALIEIREHDVREFSEGWGYSGCCSYVEDSFMQKGDYELCLKCIGDPQATFEWDPS